MQSSKKDGDRACDGRLEASKMVRLLSIYGTPAHARSSVSFISQDFITIILQAADESGGDFKNSPFTENHKAMIGRPSQFVRSVYNGDSVSRDSEIRALILAVVDELSDSNKTNRETMRLIEEACECNLNCLRYFATFTVVLLIQFLGPQPTSITDRLFAILSLRTQDTCPKIRQLATIAGYIDTFFLHGPSFVDGDQFLEMIHKPFRDPNYTVRISILRYFQESLPKNREYLELIRLYSRQIGEEVFARCFDSASTAVSVLAIRLLSDPVVGEILLGGDENKYQCLSLLVWHDKLPSCIAKEALMFVNNHILATPGIFSDKVSGSRKLSMMAEFIEQYSDGLVCPLTGRFILAFSAHVSNGADNYLIRANTFEPVIENLIDSIKDSIVRRGTLSSLFAGVPKAQDDRTDVGNKLRLNTVLEILNNASVIFDTPGLLTDQILTMISGLFECWDEAQEPCDSIDYLISGSQADVHEKAVLKGIIPRRYLFEIVYDIMRKKFPLHVFSPLERDLRNNAESRCLMFQLVRDAISNVLAHTA